MDRYCSLIEVDNGGGPLPETPGKEEAKRKCSGVGDASLLLRAYEYLGQLSPGALQTGPPTGPGPQRLCSRCRRSWVSCVSALWLEEFTSAGMPLYCAQGRAPSMNPSASIQRPDRCPNLYMPLTAKPGRMLSLSEMLVTYGVR